MGTLRKVALVFFFGKRADFIQFEAEILDNLFILYDDIYTTEKESELATLFFRGLRKGLANVFEDLSCVRGKILDLGWT